MSNFRRKKRDENEAIGEQYYPFLEEITNLGYAKMEKIQCQRRMFCKMASFGGHSENANSVQKAMFYAASLTPNSVKRKFGLKDTFEAALSGDCDRFKC